jgi:putative flippase GtrA
VLAPDLYRQRLGSIRRHRAEADSWLITYNRHRRIHDDYMRCHPPEEIPTATSRTRQHDNRQPQRPSVTSTLGPNRLAWLRLAGQANPGKTAFMRVRTVVVRLWLFAHTPEGIRMVRYGLVSVVSALFAFTVLTVVYGVLQLWTEVPSVVFSNIVATFVNYFLNRRWVWGKSGRSSLLKEVLPFWIMSISGMVLALFTASLARQFSDAHHLDHLARTVVVLGANTCAFGINWIVKFLILNRIFRQLPEMTAEAASDQDRERA